MPRVPNLERTTSTRLGTLATAIVLVFLAITTMLALSVPFPSSFDELQHLSVVRAQWQHPAAFADPRTYRVLRPDDLAQWSGRANYINHPPLYYVLLAQVMRVTSDILVLRIVNVALALAALILALWAGLRFLRAGAAAAFFVVVLAAFPKAPVIGGIVNNDNLATCAAALVFAGLTSASGGTWLIAVGLAVAGWTKLTALISLGTVVLVERGMRLVRGRIDRPARLWPIALGLAVGALPYLANLARTGHLLYVNQAAFWVAEKDRPAASFLDFARFFFGMLAKKWPAAEASLPLPIAVALVLVPLGLAVIGIRADRRVASLGIAYATGLIVTLGIHFWFGWTAFRTIGDQTIAQPRYYAVLWPGIALAAAAGLAALGKRGRWLSGLLLLALLLPTVLGGTVLALVNR